MNYLLPAVIFFFVLQASNEQKITRLTACLTGRGPKLRIDCRYQNVTNNPLKYEFKLKRNKEPEIILSTINLNFFTDKYHNRATIYTARGLVQLHIERFNASDVGLYYCTLNIPNDITVNQTAKISVQKDKLETCGGMSIFSLCTPWPLLLPLFLPILQSGVSLC
ncbi:thy-1 membrane glycoprotein [Rana temporaria]|uniref:thy-1 membrane glycoprotein n=1 Tax=Rana temporaria TaxID=8407 RepID=UPI001AAC9A95|nr:thy-1 membrane glycoprotein [Rana temporaria]XP_040181460.1 thy-1 membrane glycoprotein [Rana temporaria]